MRCFTIVIPILCTCILSSRFGLSLGMVFSTSVVDVSDYDPTDDLASNADFTDDVLDNEIDVKRSSDFQNPMMGKIPGSKVRLTPNMKKLLVLLTDLMNKNTLDTNSLRQLLSGDVKVTRNQPKMRFLYRFPFRRFGG